MFPRLHILLLFSALSAAGQDIMPGRKNPIDLLPDGSVLHGVLLPRYDERHALVSDLKARVLTLVDRDLIRGEDVLIRFFNPDRSLRGRIALNLAILYQKNSTIIAEEPVEFSSDQLLANGSGLVYGYRNGEGFLRGPATTRIIKTRETTMNPPGLHASALVALAIAPAGLHAAPPLVVSKAELAGIEAEAATISPALASANEQTRIRLEETSSASSTASAKADSFIAASGMKAVPTPTADNQPATGPLSVTTGPGDTIINCQTGMYFDADEGVLVYKGNVRVADPRFDLSGADELKVFFDKKAGAPDKSAGPTGGFGDVRKLVATGAVLIDQKSVGGKESIEASGRVLIYDVPKGEIIIQGGFPWVRQGAIYARAKEPDLTLRLQNNGSFVTEGSWEMGGSLNLQKKR